MKIKIKDNNEIRLGVRPSDNMTLNAGDVISTGSSDYNDLTNKPSIEGVELIGDVSLDDLGVAFVDDIPTDVSELVNDAGYITSADIPPIPDKTSELVNDSGFITSPNVVYCTCDTAANQAAKVATIVSGALAEIHAGDQAIVKFTNTNTASNPTLKIGNTDAKPIKRYGTTAPGTTQATSWTAGTTFQCVYDGTNWMLVSWVNTAYSEISEANITNGTSSSTGLISGRRTKKAVEAFAPVKDVEVDGESVVVDGVAEITIPPLITDLGYIDPEEYEEDMFVFLNALTESGTYKFTFGGDDFTYIVDVQSLTNEDNERIYLVQHYWGDEEGPNAEYVRAVKLIDGEVDYEITTSYITMESAVDAFASKSHVHYRTVTAALSVWDYCNGNQLIFLTDSPIIYTDTRTPRHAWLIETTTTFASPNRRFIKLTDLQDASVIYQRSGNYSAGTITWGDWYVYNGTVFTP